MQLGIVGCGCGSGRRGSGEGAVVVGAVEGLCGDALQEVGVDLQDCGVEVAAVAVEDGVVAFGGGPKAEIEGAEVGECGEGGLEVVLAWM